MGVIKNSRTTLEGDTLAEATALLAQYRASKASARIADELARAAHARLAEILGDAEVGVDADGMQVVRMPERTRVTLPTDDALALAPIVASLLRTTRYRVVG